MSDDTMSEPEPASGTAENSATKERSVDPASWPLRNVKEPHDNDVLYGRGGGTNHHPGNKRYRKMVEDRKVEYINSKRLDKPLVALNIIKEWRSQDPPGRFLKVDERTGLWNDVGDKKAREKTSQALREKAPQIRKQQEDEQRALDGGDADPDKPKMARDHSLGTELLTTDQAVTLDGFSWQEPLKDGQDGRTLSHGSLGPIPPPPGPPGSPFASGQYARFPSHGSFDPRLYSASWGLPPGAPPQYPPPGWASRENSLSQFPLPHASVTHPAVPFDTRMYSGHYPPYPPSGAAPFPYPSGSFPGYPVSPQQPSRSPSTSPRRTNPHNLDPKVASAWSGQPEAEIVRQLSTEEGEPPALPSLQKDNNNSQSGLKPEMVKRMTSHNCETNETRGPELKVKRAALNRDHSAAANRLKELSFPDKFKNGRFDAVKEVSELEKDMGRSTLGFPVQRAPVHREATALDFLEPLDSGVKPKPLTEEQRASTIDEIAQDLVKPVSLRATSRSTTIEALALDFDVDSVVKPEALSRRSTVEMVFEELSEGLAKPGALTTSDRITTSDIMDIVNEPIPDDDPVEYANRQAV